MLWTDYARFIFALLFVVALMGGLYMGLKYLTAKGMMGNFKLTPTRRLKLVEILPIDSRHKAILIKRDDEKEHLVILGPTGETVVETNITPPRIIPKNEAETA